jgi:hypothetical protein
MVEVLQVGQWPELYRLMVTQKFPDVPPKYSEAVPYFEKARVYGVLDGSRLQVGFVFGEPEDGVAFFDVVCAATEQGKWATPAVLRQLFELAFGEMGLRCVWIQPATRKALKAGLAAGFVPATPLDAGKPILVMTPGLLPRKFKQGKDKERNNGKFV